MSLLIQQNALLHGRCLIVIACDVQQQQNDGDQRNGRREGTQFFFLWIGVNRVDRVYRANSGPLVSDSIVHFLDDDGF